MRDTASRRLFGRRVIYTEVKEINRGNVIDVLQKALVTHLQNQSEIDYLYRYYRGDQPILYRVKEVRPEINNMVVENRANEIVSFKTGYLVGEPVQYVSRGEDKAIADEVRRLNDYMLSEGKKAKDNGLVEWMHICGTSYRQVATDGMADVEEDEAPFEIFTLDPRYAFVVYSVGLGNKPMMGVRYVKKEDGTLVFSCWTENQYFEVFNTWSVVHQEDQILGIPIIEYPANNARLGAFEIVIPLLDAINMTESNRVDGVEQFIQALILFHNVDIDKDKFQALKEMGGIRFRDIDSTLKAEITYLNSELNQAQTQTLVDSMYETVLTICGMPNRNGGTSTSDTGAAVILRDGWSAAEARAKAMEPIFEESERSFLKLVLRICRDMGNLSLKLSGVEIRFTRMYHENMGQKVNVLDQMLGNEMLAPELAFITSGVFPDPQLAYKMSLPYIEMALKRRALQAQNGGNANGNGSGSQTGNPNDNQGNQGD